tara:strand:+ start:645 stop:923 length:279 start_codon:yes stop_codon:yes gene_type:complete
MEKEMSNNKVIAEFMNVPKFKKASSRKMLYNKSWDWLMPVVEKIEGAGLDPHEMIDSSLRKNNQKRWRSIEDTYNVVVYLIKIHNNEQREDN